MVGEKRKSLIVQSLSSRVVQTTLFRRNLDSPNDETREIPESVVRLCRTKSSASPWGREGGQRRAKWRKRGIFRDTSPGSCILSRMFPCHSPPLMLSHCSVVHTHPLLLYCNRVPDSSAFFPPSSRFDDLVSRHDTPNKLSNCFLNFVKS